MYGNKLKQRECEDDKKNFPENWVSKVFCPAYSRTEITSSEKLSRCSFCWSLKMQQRKWKVGKYLGWMKYQTKW